MLVNWCDRTIMVSLYSFIESRLNGRQKITEIVAMFKIIQTIWRPPSGKFENARKSCDDLAEWCFFRPLQDAIWLESKIVTIPKLFKKKNKLSILSALGSSKYSWMTSTWQQFTRFMWMKIATILRTTQKLVRKRRTKTKEMNIDKLETRVKRRTQQLKHTVG